MARVSFAEAEQLLREQGLLTCPECDGEMELIFDFLGSPAVWCSPNKQGCNFAKYIMAAPNAETVVVR